MPPAHTKLPELLRRLSPRLHPAPYVFVAVPPGEPLPPRGTAICEFREAEATTLVLTETQASALDYGGAAPLAYITLTVYSSLEAVGLTAAVSTALASRGSSCNVIAGYHHDHLFVPFARAADAMAALEELQAGAERS